MLRKVQCSKLRPLDVQVATRAFAAAEERAFHAVGTGEQAQLRGGHTGGAIVVRVEADDERVAVLDVAADPFDLVGVDIGSMATSTVSGKFKIILALRRRLPRRLATTASETLLWQIPTFGSAKTFRGNTGVGHPGALEPVQSGSSTICAPRTAMPMISSFDFLKHHAALGQGSGVGTAG